jgi:hypothetical protein
MKKVFTNTEIVHVFAQQSQSEGRSSSMFFHGTKIYSYGYHYLLGEFIDPDTIVINNVGYSVTTGKHISLLSSATSHKKRFAKGNIDIDIVHLRVTESLKLMSTARTRKGYYFDVINSSLANLNDYLEYTNKGDKLGYGDAIKYKEICDIVSRLDADKDGIMAEIADIEKKKRDKEKAKNQKFLSEWRNYEHNGYFYGLSKSYLRLSQDGESVETTKGVRIERDKARVLYKLIKAGKDINGYKLDYYTVIGVKDNTLKIGCHDIPMTEVNTIGELL